MNCPVGPKGRFLKGDLIEVNQPLNKAFVTSFGLHKFINGWFSWKILRKGCSLAQFLRKPAPDCEKVRTKAKGLE